MDGRLLTKRQRFYSNTLKQIKNDIPAPTDLKFVLVQHAFAPIVELLKSLGDSIAAIIPKSSTANSNPHIVAEMKHNFPGLVFDQYSREYFQKPENAVSFLRQVTDDHPFVILEYGAYFAPAAREISHDPVLAPRLRGFVEGTENGIKGSDDGAPGYEHVAPHLHHPVVSKSRSRIKDIMDTDVGPAIWYATDKIFREAFGLSLIHYGGTFGVIGAGPIGSGILRSMIKDHITPLVYDIDMAVMAKLCQTGAQAVRQQQILSQSDVLFLNTGSSFLSRNPSLLSDLKSHVILVLSTSGDVEAGIPQLIRKRALIPCHTQNNSKITSFLTPGGKHIRIVLAQDGVGQAPNTSLEEGSSSPANLMSDMEFVGIGRYLGGRRGTVTLGQVIPPPEFIEQIILEEWMTMFGYQDSHCITGLDELEFGYRDSPQAVNATKIDSALQRFPEVSS